MIKSIVLGTRFDPETVERPAPNEPPTAFRIWRAGENKFDGGVAFFTEESAKRLMAQQAERNRQYMFDYSHLSLLSENPDAGKAAGWHRLEVRNDADGKPELWAVDCQWTEPVAKGMSAEVPEWKYFSPAFQVNEKTNEIVGYTNCAVTGNPLTHDLAMLAAASAIPVNKRLVLSGVARRPMNPKDALAVLQDPNASPEDRQAAADALAAADPAALAALLASSDAPKEEPKEEQASEPQVKDEDKATAALAALAASHLALGKKVEAFEVRDLLNGKALPPEIRQWAETQPLATVKTFLAAAKSFRPAPDAARNSSPTRGESTGDHDGFKAPPIGDPAAREIDKVLGLRPALTGKPGIGAHDPIENVRKINHILPSQIRAGQKAVK